MLPIDSRQPRPRVRRHDVVQGRRRSPAHAQRPGDHLRRHERHQRRHLAERGHGQDLDSSCCAGQATDVVLDPDSGTVLNPDTDTTVQGNLQVVYAGIRGVGVYMSPNQGQVWNLMAGGIGNPLIVDTRRTSTNVNPAAGPTPNGAQGRIVLAVPDPTGNAAQDADLRGLALRRRRHPRRRLRRALRDQGLRPELDRGPHPHRAATRAARSTRPSPPTTSAQPDYPIIGSSPVPARAITTSPWPSTRPIPTSSTWAAPRDGNQTGLIRVDTHQHLGRPLPGRLLRRRQRRRRARPGLHRPGHRSTANLLTPFSRSPATASSIPTSYLNFIRNPQDPFVANATLQRLQLRQLHQQRRRRRRGSRSTWAGPTTTASPRWSTRPPGCRG